MRLSTTFRLALWASIVVAFFVGCHAVPAQPMATPGEQGLIVGTTVTSNTIAPGSAEGIVVNLLELGLPVDLTLFVEYADGQSQQIEQHANDPHASISWQVPPTAAAGPATFRLFANRTCTCGAGFPPPQSDVRGKFVVAGNAR